MKKKDPELPTVQVLKRDGIEIGREENGRNENRCVCVWQRHAEVLVLALLKKVGKMHGFWFGVTELRVWSDILNNFTNYELADFMVCGLLYVCST